MADYIKREDAIMTAMDYEGSGNAQDASQDIAADLASIPVADVRENVRGKWTNVRISVCGSGMADCSICGATVHDTFTDKIVPNFCPNCGAEMRGEKDD